MTDNATTETKAAIMKAELKNISLKYAEEFANLAVEFVYEIANKAALLSKNQVANVAVKFANQTKESVLSLVDNIYKEEE